MGIRVVQWATGSVGRTQLHELIEHPDFDLVGVLVFDSAKAGLDAGALCGLPPTTGVIATTDKRSILDLDADVVIHAAGKAHRQDTNAEDICRLLASGASVITTTSYNHLPSYGAELTAEFAASCATGGSRFHAAGENPGFMLERLVMTLTGLSKRIDRIDLYEATDVSGIAARSMLVDLMGMGRPPSEVGIDSPVAAKLDMAYRQALEATAAMLGIVTTEIRSAADCATLPYDIEVAAGTIEAGTVVGRRFSWIARWDGKDLLAIHEEWLLTRDLPQWGLVPPAAGERAPLIRAVVTGVPTFELQLDIGFDSMPAGLSDSLPGHVMVGMSAVRAIPYVLAAPPGIVTAPVFGGMRLGYAGT